MTKLGWRDYVFITPHVRAALRRWVRYLREATEGFWRTFVPFSLGYGLAYGDDHHWRWLGPFLGWVGVVVLIWLVGSFVWALRGAQQLAGGPLAAEVPSGDYPALTSGRDPGLARSLLES